MDHPIVLFDGECNLCSWSIQFIIKHDPHARFQFAALQSAVGQQLLREHSSAAQPLDSVVLIEDGTLHTRSDAALRIAGGLVGWWRWLRLLIYVPRVFRDWVYSIVARNRYHWFGQTDRCIVPTPDIRRRFLDALQ